MKKIFLLIPILLISFFKGYAQDDPNPITTAAPFLLIAPDARSGGMGDIGVGTSPDGASLHFNAAKNVFSESEYVIGVHYTPWLRNLTSDVFVSNISFAKRINDGSTFGASLKYFSLGTIELTDGDGQGIGSENPNELSLDLSYGLKLSPEFAMAVSVRYLRSDYALRVENSVINTVNNVAVDVSGYYQSEEKNYGDFNGIWRGGFNISNIGQKVTLTDGGQENFMPTNLKIGGGFEFILDGLNSITANLEFNKLLVPSPPLRENDGTIIDGKDDDVGFLAGMFQSFGDAPGGNELKEYNWAAGAEYMYDKTFAMRLGYFNESDYAGGRKYFTLGTGFKFKATNLDLSYLINSTDVNNPLENTLRFSLTFNFGDIYENF